MKRIAVDFNTLNSAPVDVVKLGTDGTENGRRIQPVEPGQRVLLYDDEFEVEATILYDPEQHFWMAEPDFTTWKAAGVPV